LSPFYAKLREFFLVPIQAFCSVIQFSGGWAREITSGCASLSGDISQISISTEKGGIFNAKIEILGKGWQPYDTPIENFWKKGKKTEYGTQKTGSRIQKSAFITVNLRLIKMIIDDPQHVISSTHYEQRTPSHGDLAIDYFRFTIDYLISSLRFMCPLR